MKKIQSSKTAVTKLVAGLIVLVIVLVSVFGASFALNHFSSPTPTPTPYVPHGSFEVVFSHFWLEDASGNHVSVGSIVKIQGAVTNTGDASGICTVVASLPEFAGAEQKQAVVLASGESKEVTFTFYVGFAVELGKFKWTYDVES